MVFVITGAAALALLALAGLAAAIHFKHAPVRALLGSDGYQEASVVINGRYRPDTLVVEQGVPVRLRLLRGEDNPCSERVVFSAFGVDRRLPAFQETTVEFVPRTAGRYLFTCHLGMYRGSLVVVPPPRRREAARSIEREDGRAASVHVEGPGGAGNHEARRETRR